MSYASKIKEQKTKSGARIFATTFQNGDEISFVGSLASPARALQAQKVADVHAAMLLEGTARKSKQDIQILLDDWGATLSFYVAKERLYFSGRVRVSNAKKPFSLIREVLIEPTFPNSELAHLKARMESELALEAQDTRSQASIHLSRMLYPSNHPNYHESTEESLGNLRSTDIKKIKEYHALAINGSSLLLSVAGDITMKDVEALAATVSRGLPTQSLAAIEYEKTSALVAQQSRIDIKDKASIDCIFGIATGITKDHPDFPALVLGVQILGNSGGFTGRLMKIVREIEGLTYGTYAYLSGFTNADGYISVWGTFAPQLFKKGHTALLREIRSIVEKGVTAEEVKNHKSMYEARSRVLIADSAAFAKVAHDIAVERRSVSYLDEFPQRILKLTKAQVDKAFKKYLIPERMSESSAGPLHDR